MLSRRGFFKGSLLFGTSVLYANENEVDNILEFAKLEITFAKGGSQERQQHLIDELFEMLSIIDTYDMLLNFETEYPSTLYLPEIDNLLIRHQDGLEYPMIELFHHNKPLKLPEISLYVKMHDPSFFIQAGQRLSKTSTNNVFQRRPKISQAPLDQIKISVSGDLEYQDVDRPNKKFSLKDITC